MSFCTKCGKQNDDAAKFCTGCGATLKDSVIQPTPDPIAPEVNYSVEPEHSSISKSKWIAIGIVVLLGLGAGAYLIFFNKKKQDNTRQKTMKAMSDSTRSGLLIDSTTVVTNDRESIEKLSETPGKSKSLILRFKSYYMGDMGAYYDFTDINTGNEITYSTHDFVKPSNKKTEACLTEIVQRCEVEGNCPLVGQHYKVDLIYKANPIMEYTETQEGYVKETGKKQMGWAITNLEKTGESNSWTTEHSLVFGTYTGTIGSKKFIIKFESVSGNKVRGYNITGNNRRPFEGVFTESHGSFDQFGDRTVMVTTNIYKLVLKEPGTDEWDGEFDLRIELCDWFGEGKGIWHSYNGKLNRTIKFSDTELEKLLSDQ